jgi:hypothetical protein
MWASVLFVQVLFHILNVVANSKFKCLHCFTEVAANKKFSFQSQSCPKNLIIENKLPLESISNFQRKNEM